VTTCAVRAALPRDLVAMQDIERAAGILFAEVGMDEIAAADPPSLATLRGDAARRRAWIAADEDDVPVGFALVDIVEGCAHLQQISVLPAHQRQGRGRELVATVAAWARTEAWRR
jgi:GNAT superfamily N-acetyltransferase